MMKSKRMMDIHVDALAYAAGVRTMDNMAVSHPPSYPRPSRRWGRKLVSRALRTLASVAASLASTIERSGNGPTASDSSKQLECCS